MLNFNLAVVEGHPMILLICCLVRALCCGNGEAKSRQMEYLYRVTTKGLRGEALILAAFLGETLRSNSVE